jgi:protein-tyrosine-phosphatase
MEMRKSILVICDDNTLLSKLGEAYLKKYAGYWKDIHSAGLETKGRACSPELWTLLEKEGLTKMVDGELRSLKSKTLNTNDSVIALTKESYLCMKELYPKLEIILVELPNSNTVELGGLSDMIKEAMFRYAKNGPMRRWLNEFKNEEPR